MEGLFQGTQQLQDMTATDKPKPQKSMAPDTASDANIANVQPKRMKLSDNLRIGDQPASNRFIEKLSHAHPSPRRAESPTFIPIKTYQIPPLTRNTRSFFRKQNVEIHRYVIYLLSYNLRKYLLSVAYL